ncbi:putative E3 ubiquitin-protein ligase MID2 isoform X2 [Convolutriloba macropyga]|uniref:putative E3 ubiquitin-protein ligase MID2 isoform X2 n=1 Tax=Convolutriloba macropyga TaxID=536237 RepID=UPI003F520A27
MDGLRLELSCVVCKELFTNPVTLPCLHSVCSGCLHAVVAQHQCNAKSVVELEPDNEKVDHGSEKDITENEEAEDVPKNSLLLVCPFCREKMYVKRSAKTNGPELELNRLLCSIVERYKSSVEETYKLKDVESGSKNDGMDKSTSPAAVMASCDMCEDESAPAQPACKYCVECKVLYCETCFTQCHRMKGPFASHTIQSPSASRKQSDASDSKQRTSLLNVTMTCDSHDGEKINMYCTECDKLICALCKLVGVHKEHLVNDLGTSYKQKQGELGQSCEMLTEVSEGLIGSMEKIKESQVVYKESKAETEKQIVDEIGQLQKMLEDKKDAMIQSLRDHYDQRLSQLESDSESVKESLELTHGLLSLSTEAMKEADQTAFLQFCSRLCARVNTAKDRAHQLTKAFAQLDSQGGEGSFGEQQLFVDFSLEKKNINRLDFLKPPEPVKLLKELCISKPNSLKLRWSQSSFTPVSEYHVIYRLAEESADNEWIPCDPVIVDKDQRADSSDAATMVEYTIKGLESDVGYEVCVVAVNMAGQSSPPEGQEDTTEHEEYSVVVLRTALPIPKTPEVDEDECSVAKNVIMFRWKSLLDVSSFRINQSNTSRSISHTGAIALTPGSDIVRGIGASGALDRSVSTCSSNASSLVTFVVEFREDSDDEWTIRRQMESCEMELCDLKYNTMYVVRVKALSSSGASPYSNEKLFTTWPLPPEAPKMLRNHCKGGPGNKLFIQWSYSDDDSESVCSKQSTRENPADSYTVEYRPAQRGNDWNNFEGIQMSHCHLKDLLFDTEYTVRVKAHNMSGESDYSDSVLLRTGLRPIEFTPDANTAHVNLKISGCTVQYDRGGAKSRVAGENCFIGASFSVLGDMSVNKGRHYWEVKIKTKSTDRIGIAYGSTGRDCLIGDSDKSWAVGFLPNEDDKKLFTFHNKKKKRLNVDLPPNPNTSGGGINMKSVTIGTLVDFEEQYVAFFISEFHQHVHTFKTNFTEAVFPAFSVWPNDIQISSGLQIPDFLLV